MSCHYLLGSKTPVCPRFGNAAKLEGQAPPIELESIRRHRSPETTSTLLTTRHPTDHIANTDCTHTQHVCATILLGRSRPLGPVPHARHCRPQLLGFHSKTCRQHRPACAEARGRIPWRVRNAPHNFAGCTESPIADLIKHPLYSLFGFLLGSTLAGGSVYTYVLQEYKASNELLTEDIYVRYHHIKIYIYIYIAWRSITCRGPPRGSLRLRWVPGLGLRTLGWEYFLPSHALYIDVNECVWLTCGGFTFLQGLQAACQRLNKYVHELEDKMDAAERKRK